MYGISGTLVMDYLDAAYRRRGRGEQPPTVDHVHCQAAIEGMVQTGVPTGTPVRTGAPTGAPGRRTELRRGRKTGTPTGVPVYFHAAPRTPPSASAQTLRRDETGGGGEGNTQSLDILAGPHR